MDRRTGVPPVAADGPKSDRLLAVTITAGGTLNFEGVSEPDSAAAAAPMPVQLMLAETQMHRQRRHSKISEATGRAGRTRSRVWEHRGVIAALAVMTITQTGSQPWHCPQ